MTEVFVRSFSAYVDVETYREMSTHSYCAPGTGSGSLKDLEPKFKDVYFHPMIAWFWNKWVS